MQLSGDFAHARYEGFNTYGSVANEVGIALDSLADSNIVPETGSTNPFAAGARRDAKQRRYQISVSPSGAPDPNVGFRDTNVLYGLSIATPLARTAVRQEIIYRVYVPDSGRDATGGVGLPIVELMTFSGTTLRGDEACTALNVSTSAPTSATGLLSADTYRQLVQLVQLVQLGDPATHPAHSPPTWLRFFNPRFNVLASFWKGTAQDGHIATLDSSVRKGLYGNIDIDYGVAAVSRAFGGDPNGHNVLVLRGRAPVTPHTSKAQSVMDDAQLRHWSLCQNESPVTTRVSDCLYDEQVPVGADGFFTIVISLIEDRPTNATDSCGVAWMQWGSGDGVDRPQSGVLILRHMLPSPTFATTWAGVTTLGDESLKLGDYLPEGRYLTETGFEQLGCPPKG